MNAPSDPPPEVPGLPQIGNCSSSSYDVTSDCCFELNGVLHTRSEYCELHAYAWMWKRCIGQYNEDHGLEGDRAVTWRCVGNKVDDFGDGVKYGMALGAVTALCAFLAVLGIVSYRRQRRRQIEL